MSNQKVHVTTVTRPDSLASKTALKMRRKMYHHMEQLMSLGNLDAILDVGVTADRERLDSNFFEMLYPEPRKITALSNQDAAWMEEVYPGLRFVLGDGCALPFADNSFDLTFSSAVLEHVGNAERQAQFIRESFRVSRKYLFLTTPNRFHPLEFHTTLPLLHWLPKKLHRTVLKTIGYQEFAQESVLNLTSEAELSAIAEELKTDYRIDALRFFGFRSNLLLFIRKEQPPQEYKTMPGTDSQK